MSRKHLTLLAALAIAGCEFTDYDPVVPYGKLNYAQDGALGMAADGATLWVHDLMATTSSYTHELKVFDTSTGNKLGGVSWGGTWEPRAIAPDHGSGHEDQAWVQYANGYRVLWNPTLVSYTDYEVPIPSTGATAASSRVYCDMDRSEDDVFYITTIDTLSGASTSYLYREPTEGVWERTALTDLNGKCGRVSVDDVTSEVAVLDLTHDVVYRYDESGLSYASEMDVSATAGDATDLAVKGSYTLMGFRGATSSSDRLVLFAADGSEEDSEYLGRIAGVIMQYDGSDFWAWWSGIDTSPVKYTAGRFMMQ